MILRILTRVLVALIVFSVCYYAWWWAWMYGLPPDFGMPDYEDEIELALLVGSVAFAVVPALISVWAWRRLNLRLVDPGLQSDDLIL